MNIAVASARLLIRKSLCTLISQMNGYRVVLDLDSPFDNLELLRKSHLDILLIDTASLVDGHKLIPKLCSILPQTKILLLSGDTHEDYQVHAIRDGARGFISETCDPRILDRALQLVAKGEIWVTHHLATRIIGQFMRLQEPGDGNNAKLSRREREILALLAQGHRNKEIASLLSISHNTIRAHLATLYRKIHVDSRLGAALYYFEEARRDANELPGSTAQTRPIPESSLQVQTV